MDQLIEAGAGALTVPVAISSASIARSDRSDRAACQPTIILE